MQDSASILNLDNWIRFIFSVLWFYLLGDCWAGGILNLDHLDPTQSNERLNSEMLCKYLYFMALLKKFKLISKWFDIIIIQWNKKSFVILNIFLFFKKQNITEKNTLKTTKHET